MQIAPHHTGPNFTLPIISDCFEMGLGLGSVLVLLHFRFNGNLPGEGVH